MRKRKILMSLDDFSYENFGKRNAILKKCLLLVLRAHVPQLTEEEQEMEKARKTGSGRKKREVTDEMIQDLHVIPMEEYMAKHSVGEVYFLNLYYSNVKTKEAHDDMFEGLICDTDILYDSGVKSWLKHIGERQKKTDLSILDILHYIEIKECNQAKKIALFDMLAELRKQRRIEKDSYEFFNDNKQRIIDYLELKRVASARRERLENKTYCTRVLVDELGTSMKGND